MCVFCIFSSKYLNLNRNIWGHLHVPHNSYFNKLLCKDYMQFNFFSNLLIEFFKKYSQIENTADWNPYKQNDSINFVAVHMHTISLLELCCLPCHMV